MSQGVPIPRGSQFRVVKEYLAAQADLGKGRPTFFGLEGYIEAKILVEGLRRMGNSASGPAALIKAMETMRDFDLGDYYVTYTPNMHGGSTFVELNIINSSGQVVR